MITLKSTFNEDFLTDAKEYPARPSKSEQDIIRYYEREILNRTDAFLSDPQFMIDEWERLTEGEMPSQYTRDIPEEIKNPVYGGKGKGIIYYRMEYLPVIDAKGNIIDYPEDRLVSNFIRFDQKVYVLQDSVLKKMKQGKTLETA
jgi:hypothetical protein